MSVRDSSSARPGVGDLTRKFSKKALKWTAIYFWGYFGLGVGWLTVPLMVSILRWIVRLVNMSSDHFRYERRKESQLRISAAKSLGSGQEKEVILFWSSDSGDSSCAEWNQLRSSCPECRIFPPGSSSRTSRGRSGSTGEAWQRLEMQTFNDPCSICFVSRTIYLILPQESPKI